MNLYSVFLSSSLKFDVGYVNDSFDTSGLQNNEFETEKGQKDTKSEWGWDEDEHEEKSSNRSTKTKKTKSNLNDTELLDSRRLNCAISRDSSLCILSQKSQVLLYTHGKGYQILQNHCDEGLVIHFRSSSNIS